MPWTIDKVEEHIKGLTPSKKKQWVEIANSVLKKCISNGGTDKTCAPSAIRQANGVVGGNQQVQINFKIDDYEVREETHQGKSFLVVPVTMMVEGVHHGSHGPLLHTIEDLGKFPASWDGIPIVKDHPEIDGLNVSANSPEIIDTVMIGRIYRTHVDGSRLKAEAWFDKEKLISISPESYESIQNGDMLEVSVGVFTEDENVENGDWNGEKYSAIARNHRPDHLALLPGGIGACSIEDGCGIRANKEKGGDKIDDNVVNITNECVEFAKSAGSEMTISINNDNNLNLNNKEVKTMAEDVKKPCGQCMEKVIAIINSNKTNFTAVDREWLLTQDEAVLDKLIPKELEVNVELTGEQIITALKSMKPEERIQLLPIEDQEVIAYGKQQKKERRSNLIKGIQDNTSKVLWPDDVLNTMSEDHLQRVFNTVKKEEVVDYSVNGGGRPVINSITEEPLYPTGIEIETKK
jgi:hypothetical protein